ncbi:MAG: nucleotidyltransferase domain-containing protein [Alphaproteobacteria bacterium]|nr:nucleotidyltransferase domain-containing protein [Alphaproteobacteria bacterium]
MLNASDAIKNAKDLWENRYTGAEFVIAAGSIMRGQGTLLSDLDLVVIYNHLDAAYRESFLFNEMPVEAFVHDYETIQAFMNEGYKDAEVSIIHMIATGEVVPQANETAQKLQAFAMDLLAKGAEELDVERRNVLRYSITDLIDDLKGSRPSEENRAIFYALYPKFCELSLRASKHFVGSGKHLAKALSKHDQRLLQTLETVALAIHQDDLRPEHIKMLEEELNSLGGRLFDGDKRVAPKDKRQNPVWLQDDSASH